MRTCKPLRRRLLGVLLALACLARPAATAAEPETVDLPPVPAGSERPALRERQTLSDKQAAELAADRQRRIAARLRQARVLMRLGRYREAASLCDEALLVDPASKEARLLRETAVKRQSAVKEANLQGESARRDKAVLEEVTRMGMVPERGADAPRPDRFDHPFQENARQSQEMRDILESRIPEINVIDTDLAYILQLLVTVHDVNIIYPPEVVEGKRLTMQLRNVTLGDVLDYLADSQGLYYTVRNGIVLVYGEDAANGGFNHFNPEIIQLKTGITRDASLAAQPDAGGEGGGDAVATDIESMLEWMEDHWPGWPPESTWRLNYKNNQLVVCSTPRVVEDVRKVVATLDRPPVQVLITANFLEIAQEDLRQLGVDWSVEGNQQPDAADYGGFDDKITISDEVNNPTNILNILGSNVVQPGADQAGLDLGAIGILNEHQFHVTLKALQQNAGTKTVTAPRIIARNNLPAEINLTTNVPFVREYETETSGVSSEGGANITNTISTPVWDEVEEGYKLTVMPSVGGDMRSITLQIVPEIIRLMDLRTADIITVQGQGNATATGTVSAPEVQESSIKVEATVEDGSTLVVGGLVLDSEDERERKVPLLGDIPLVGKAFRSTAKGRQRSFLLVFVTARILTPDNRHLESAPPSLAERRRPEVPATGVEEMNRLLGDPLER